LVAAICTILALVSTPEALGVEGTYSMTVEGIRIRGREVAATDTALHRDDGDEQEVRQGDRFATGDRVEVLYPEVQLFLRAEEGTTVVLECARCTPEAPLVFVVGDPAAGKPFEQQHGNVTYQVEPQEEGLFEILLEVITGPDRVEVPVAVKGTLFMLEPNRVAAWLLVGDGSVLVRVPGSSADSTVAPGEALAGSPGAPARSVAPADRLAYMADVVGPSPTMFLDPAKGSPRTYGRLVEPGAGAPTATAADWASWTMIGTGAASVLAGTVVHYLAWREESAVASEVSDLCLAPASFARARRPLERQHMALTDADATYDDLYDDRVAPLETSAWALYGAGVALAAGGILWRVLDRSAAIHESRGQWQLAPLPAAGFAVQGSWTF